MVTPILWILGLFSILFLMGFIRHWKDMNRLSGVVMAGMVFLFIPSVWGIAVINHGVSKMTSVEFCNSCHVMQAYVTSLQSDDSDSVPAIHYQNNWIPQKRACYDCHTSYTLFGGVKAKINGLKHVWVNYLGTIPENLKVYEPYNNRDCLRCHGPAKNFRENEDHEDDLEAMQSNETSCLECHDVMHVLPEKR